MPLVLCGNTLELLPDRTTDSIHDFLKKFPQLEENAKELKSKPVKEVSPEKLLFVNQREYAIVDPKDSVVDIIGTEDATTCHIVVLRHSGCGVTCLAHCDGCGTKEAVKSMVNAVKLKSRGAPEGRIELHLVGGFIDEKNESCKLTSSILGAFHNLEDEVNLVTACITDLNDTIKNGVHFPVIYGLAVEVKMGMIYPARFPKTGPVMDVRSASHFVGSKKMVNIYDAEKGEIVIGPYTWEPWQDINMWLALPNESIRKYLSTSPAQEPDYFEDHVRAALSVIQRHPNPMGTLFPDKQSWYFIKDESGLWQQKL